MKKFSLCLLELQPSQLYISYEKLRSINYTFSCGGTTIIEAPSVTQIDGKWVITEGHTRCLALYLKGLKQIKVQQECNTLDIEMYRICLDWCTEANITDISDLKQRVISHREFEIKWIQRCQRAQAS